MNVAADFPTQVEVEQRYLMRYARSLTRDDQLAQELVQDTILAALENAAGFSGRSSLRTWLTSILRNKWIDEKRRDARRVELTTLDDEGGEDDSLLDRLFKEDGHWTNFPAQWANPDAACESSEFFTVFEKCMDGLPKQTARVFFLREVMGEETEDICKEVSISSSNCWVLLHRARLRLRECLERNWFGNLGESKRA